MSPTDIRKEPFAIDCLKRAEAFIKERELADAETLSAGAKKRQRKSKMLSALRKKNPCPAAMKKIGPPSPGVIWWTRLAKACHPSHEHYLS